MVSFTRNAYNDAYNASQHGWMDRCIHAFGSVSPEGGGGGGLFVCACVCVCVCLYMVLSIVTVKRSVASTVLRPRVSESCSRL